MSHRPFAIVTGASTGIGFELAALCAREGWDVLIAADEPQIEEAAARLREHGTQVTAVEADLSTTDGVDVLVRATGGRRVDYLLANAGRGLGHGFLDQSWDKVRRVIDTNITGTIYLIQEVGREMRTHDSGHILITGSVAGYTPGPFHAVYNATKAFVDSFAWAFRNEMKGTNVVITLLMPGATETEFFARAGLMDTKIGQAEKDDAAAVAKTGFDAMMRGDADVVHGFKNKVQTTMANVTSAERLAEQHRKLTEPGSAGK